VLLKNTNGSHKPLNPSTRLRPVLRYFLTLGLGVLIGFVALTRPLRDFVEYWVVGHLFVDGRNCYSLTEIFRVEQGLGWKEPIPLVPLNPPWVLPALASLGAFKSYVLAWLVWSLFLVVALCISSHLLLNIYAPEVRLRDISDSIVTRSLFVFSFYPTLLALRFSQMTPFILLGVAAFLWLEKGKKQILSGSALALAGFKPQLVYLILVAAVFTSIRRRSFRILFGLAWPLALLTGIAVVKHPGVLREYWHLSTGPYVRVYPSAMGAILRLPFGSRDTFLMQFVPTAAGLMWFVHHWRKNKDYWNWASEVPILIAVSVLTTSWGWLFDQMMLVIPVIALFSTYARNFGRIPPRVVWLYTALNVALICGAISNSSTLMYVVAPVVMLSALSLSIHRNLHRLKVSP
jgi:hypothetical protein